MSEFDNIGQLKCLPLKDIYPSDKISNVSNFIITAAAEAIREAKGHNWQPLIVKEIAKECYQAVGNLLVYTAVKQANFERIWCIVIDDKPQHIQQVQILSGEIIPKINLNTASAEAIKTALNYLQEKSLLRLTNLATTAQKIANADRASWQDFNKIPKLRCGITAVKVKVLNEVFYLQPTLKIELPPLPEAINIKRSSTEKIYERLNYLATYKIDGFENIDPEKATDIIFMASKSRWKSLNPIATLNCGISKNQIKSLKPLFKLQ